MPSRDKLAKVALKRNLTKLFLFAEVPLKVRTSIVSACLILWMIARSQAALTVTATNDLDIPRPSETIELKWSDIAAALPGARPDLVVVLGEDGKQTQAQPIWLQPSKRKPADQLIFQADFAAHETKRFTLEKGEPEPYEPKVYGRWVPEREDDYGWESDRIAYRIFGPALEKSDPAGSGVDVWPKRTRNLIINKWYQLAQSINGGYYHIDHGEGQDDYEVHRGQGCGGTAILAGGKRFTTGPKGWQTQRTLANGPIRLIFELTYDAIDVNGVGVKETKRVSLDAGWNLNHFQSTFTTDKPMDDLQVLAGIVEHRNRKYFVDFSKPTGSMTYWDIGDAPGEKPPAPNTIPTGWVGCAVIMPTAKVADEMEIDGQMEMVTHATSGEPVNFWAGAGWDRSGDFKDYNAWKAYIATYVQRLASPVKVTLSK
jgi:pectinesterase